MLRRGDIVDWYSPRGIKVVTVLLIDGIKCAVEDDVGFIQIARLEDCEPIEGDEDAIKERL